MTGFLGVLLMLNPLIGALVLLAALPTLWMQLRLNRARAAMVLRMEHFQRRDLFFAQLLVGVPAAKEVRLFGLGRFFGDRMLDELHGMHRVRAETGPPGGARPGGAAACSARRWRASGWSTPSRSPARAGSAIGDVVIFMAAIAGGAGRGWASPGRPASARSTRRCCSSGTTDRRGDVEPDLPVPAPPRPACRPLRDGIELRDVWFRYWRRTIRGCCAGVDLRIPRGRGGRAGRAQRRRQEHPGQAAVPVLRPGARRDPLGRRRPAGRSTRRELRARIGAVFQDYMAYDLSAAENIGARRPAALDDRRRDRARPRAGAGIDARWRRCRAATTRCCTRIFATAGPGRPGGRASMLSGGQWQRVALARALHARRRGTC